MKAVVAVLAVALAGAGLGGAVLTGTLPLTQTNAAEPEPAQGWEVLETFTGEAGDAATGTLDLRAFWGNIQVVGWSEPSYEITVYQRAPQQQDGQRLSDAAIEATFEELREDGLGLRLVVQRTGSYDIHVNEDSWTDIAVVANVPGSIDWSTVFVCTGETHASVLREALMPLLAPLHEPGEEDQACVEGSPMLGMDIGSISLGDSSSDEEEVWDFPFELVGLHGTDLMVQAQYADLALDGLSFAKASVMTQYGNVLGGIDAPELAVMSQYGRIGLTTVTDAADIGSQYGDLYLAFGPGNAGAYNVATQYGDIVAGVVAAPDRGYDAEAATQYGEALIILDGIQYGEEEDDDGALLTKAGLPLLGDGPVRERDSSGNSIVQARSENFDAAPVQVIVKALTQYGDALITDGEMPEAEDDEDHN